MKTHTKIWSPSHVLRRAVVDHEDTHLNMESLSGAEKDSSRPSTVKAHTKMESLSGVEKDIDSDRPSTVKAHTKMESLSGAENGRHRRPTL